MGDETKEIVLWGYTDTGKTTALATYVCRSQLPWVDPNAEISQKTRRELDPIYSALTTNCVPRSTRKAEAYGLACRSGTLVNLRDMIGGNARSVFNNKEDEQRFFAAHGVVLFVRWPEWPAGDHHSGWVAVLRALEHDSSHRPMCVAVTKVESFFSQTDWFEFERDPVLFARGRGLPEDFVQLLEKVGSGRVFPLSVYGNRTKGGRPNHYRDEFDRLIPSSIQPRGVDRPFDWILREVGVIQERSRS